MEHPPLVFHAISNAEVLTLVHDLLAGLDGDVAVTCNLLGRGKGGVDAFLGLVEELCGQPPFGCLLRSNVVAGQDDVHGPALSDGAGQPLATTTARNGAQLDLGLAKGGVGAGIQDVGHHGELAATPKGISIDSGDEGLLEKGHKLGPVLDEVVPVGGAECEVLHLLDVCSGSEGALGAGQDDGTDGVVLLVGAQLGIELEDEGCAECVQGFGAVQLDCVGSQSGDRLDQDCARGLTEANAGLW